MTIGIFDSGIGGLGIFDEIRKLMPNENILYLADTKNCPYGEKSEEQIKRICLNNANFLINKGADSIVIACNTGSTIALNYLRGHLRGGGLGPRSSNGSEVGDSSEAGSVIPVVGVVPVVKTCSEVSKNKRIGILATTRTVESQYLRDLVDKFCPPTLKLRKIKFSNQGFKVYYQAANELVEIVENDSTNSKFQFEIFNQTQNSNFKTLKHLNFNKNLKLKIKNYQLLRKYLDIFISEKVDVVALGCTHFPFLRQQIEQIMGDEVRILDSNSAVARQTKKILESFPRQSASRSASIRGGKYQFYTTGDSEKLKSQINNLIGFKTDKVEKVNV